MVEVRLFFSLCYLSLPSLTERIECVDVGKILCGIQVPPSENEAFDEWLMNLGYPFVEETKNPAYADFLGDDEGSGTEEEE